MQCQCSANAVPIISKHWIASAVSMQCHALSIIAMPMQWQCSANAVPMHCQCGAKAMKAIVMLSNADEKQCFCQERKILGRRRQEEEEEKEEKEEENTDS